MKKGLGPPKGVNYCLMTVGLPLLGKQHTTLFSAYAQIMTSSNDAKEKFYQDFKSTIAAVPSTDKLIILSDFNARVGIDSVSWGGNFRTKGIGSCNSSTTGNLCLTWGSHHQLHLSPASSKQDIMDTSSLKALVLTGYVIVRQKGLA